MSDGPTERIGLAFLLTKPIGDQPKAQPRSLLYSPEVIATTTVRSDSARDGSYREQLPGSDFIPGNSSIARNPSTMRCSMGNDVLDLSIRGIEQHGQRQRGTRREYDLLHDALDPEGVSVVRHAIRTIHLAANTGEPVREDRQQCSTGTRAERLVR